MNNVNLQINLLIDVLFKKVQFLQQLLTYTTEQSKLAQEDMEAFNNIMQSKEILINKVAELDDGFQSIYRHVRSILETQPELYKEKIQTMKQAITKIGELSIAITVQEGRNKNQLDLKTSKSATKEIQKTQKAVASSYTNMNKQMKTNQVSTFDTKK